MDGRPLMIVLRLLHVLGGILWVGWMIVAAWFLYPAMRETGDGARMIERMMIHRRLAVWVSAASGLAILTGLWMYGRVAMATDGAWMTTRPGLAYGIGGVLALAASIAAGAVLVPTGRRLVAVGARVREHGAPSPADLAEAGRLQARLLGASRLVAVLLVLTAALMAVARYL